MCALAKSESTKKNLYVKDSETKDEILPHTQNMHKSDVKPCPAPAKAGGKMIKLWEGRRDLTNHSSTAERGNI